MHFLGQNWAVFGIAVIEKHFEIDSLMHGGGGSKKKEKKGI